MNGSIKFLLGVSISSTMVACAPRKNNSPDEASIERRVYAQIMARLDAQDAASDAPEAPLTKTELKQQIPTSPAAEPAKPLGIVVAPVEKRIRYDQKGGSPGTVSLKGGFAAETGGLDSRVTVDLRNGVGRDGNTRAVEERIDLTAKLTSAPSFLKRDKVVSLGCGTDLPSEARGLKVDSADGQSSIHADVILVCGAALEDMSLKFEKIILHADIIAMKDVTFNFVGTSDDALFMTARELKFVGKNLITAKAVDGPSTVISPPQIYLAAKTLSGDGTLAITSQGASYVEPKDKSAQSAE